MKAVTVGCSPLMIHGILAGFRKLGFDGDHFPHRSWMNLEPETGKEKLAGDLYTTRPDILIFGGYAPRYFEILPDLCRKMNTAFVYWAIEDPPGFERTLFLAQKADLVLTTAVEYIPRYQREGIKARLMPFACNPDYHQAGSYKQEYDLDLALVASYYTWETRRRGYDIILDPARKSNHSLRVWGAGWEREKGKKRLVDPELYGGYFPNGSLPELCASTKIILGVQCADTSRTQTSMRPYEILGCRGFLLTQWTEATTKMFTDGRHLVTANSPEETREKINYYLQHPAARKEIACQGQKYVYRHHTYRQRIKHRILPYL